MIGKVINFGEQSENFKEFLTTHSPKSKVALVYFFSKATSGEQSEATDEVFHELAQQYPELACIRVEAEAYPELVAKYQVTLVPSFVFIKDGLLVDRAEGLEVDRLFTLCKKYSTDLASRIKELLDQHPLMIFIKGTPKQPRCGFTAKLLSLLDELDVEFGYFDILRDEEIRQGLKEYSNWPTYPQIYVRGELIGGLDIFVELKESNQLGPILSQLEGKC